MRTWMRNARKNANLTQAQLAEQVGIDRVYYTNIENGKRGTNLSAMLIMSIAAAVGMPVEHAMQAESEYKASIERAEQF